MSLARKTLTEGVISKDFLNELLRREFINESLVEKIKGDEELSRFFKKSTPKKGGKAKKVSSSDTERNGEDYDCHRCCARIWKADGGLGYDNIQCNSKNMVTGEKVEEILVGMGGDPDEIEAYLEKYDGCFCKKHLSMDFFMPKGYWLGKVNEPRPEKPMLPVGSVKKGFTEEYKEHYWMIDEEGNKVEKKKRKSSSKKKEVSSEEEDDGSGTGLMQEEKKKKVKKSKGKSKGKSKKVSEEKTEEEKKEMEEFLEWKRSQMKEEPEKEKEGEDSDGGETESLSEEEDECGDKDVYYEGEHYICHWDEDVEKLIILEHDEYCRVGVPRGELKEGQVLDIDDIIFDEGQREEHENRKKNK